MRSPIRRDARTTAPTVWGLTASDGPADVTVGEGTAARLFRTYAARGAGQAGGYDDCTLAPTAVVGSLPFAPELVIPAVLDMHKRFGEHIYAQYGFLDAFNLNFDYDIPLRHGRCIPGFGWVAGDYLGIDQGAILAMIENYRSGMIWDVMRKNPYVRRGLSGPASKAAGSRRRRNNAGVPRLSLRGCCVALVIAASLLVAGCSPAPAAPTPSDSGRWAARARSSRSWCRSSSARIPASASRCSSCPGARRTRSCSPRSRATPPRSLPARQHLDTGVRRARRARAARRKRRGSSTIEAGDYFPGIWDTNASKASSTACPGTSTRGSCSIAAICWRKPATTHRRDRGPSGRRCSPRSSSATSPEHYGIVLPANEFEPLVALALQQDDAAAARRRPLRQLSKRRLHARLRVLRRDVPQRLRAAGRRSRGIRTSGTSSAAATSSSTYRALEHRRVPAPPAAGAAGTG